MRYRITWAAGVALLVGLFVQGTTVGAFTVEQERQRIERTQPDLLGDYLNAGAITLPAPQSFAFAEAAAEHDLYIGGYCTSDGLVVADSTVEILDAILNKLKGQRQAKPAVQDAELTIEILDAILNKLKNPFGFKSQHAIVLDGQNSESMIEILDAWGRKVLNIVWGV